MKFSRRTLLKSSIAAASLQQAMQLSAKSTQPFKLGIITDEITTDLDQAVAFLRQYNLHYAELREIWSHNLMAAPQEDLDRAKKLLAKNGITVSDIGSPIFKWNLPEMPTKANEKRDTFKANFTEDDGTWRWRNRSSWLIFSARERCACSVTGAWPILKKRTRWCATSGESSESRAEKRYRAGAGKRAFLQCRQRARTGTDLKEINSPALRGNWDPGNAAMLDEVPYPDGYEAVKGLFAHVHVKDVRKNATTGKKEWAPVGGGFIDWKGQFQALHRDGYTGTMSLETHYQRPDKNKVESTRESLEGLLKIV